ncbi:U11/U12 small nuclear ribonucleoprotein 59 kDa protein isoform X1 [Benincasa hispida]|uniref:U11/U12 small nuclear ribonucleoprotein 59 kDa protein isoform X1 n=2 Tax=Benincasa hispida TaxID=102211 RepID=UPI001900EB8C|nr:U11/U12 small nuclear ribonucleoprotein 59 kDa protein isoform X1 [Benincasa hispida]XP_038877455.1 U11/U12 small nuclear ribonucleoprotein 59 kDa protein isoform X1 [Benincasa hispida]XP_038877456.1 U11/U12 small nuclear ribonucleoprotein 59 kDa protein isoform X1 [Benincasa hispida]
MNPVPHQFAPQPPWFPVPPPNPPPSSCSSFWDNLNVRDRLRDLQDTLDLAKSMQKELEMLMIVKEGNSSEQSADNLPNGSSIGEFSDYLKDRRINSELQESRSVEIAAALMKRLRAQLHPFSLATDESSLSEAVKLSGKLLKAKRNKQWRKKKRKRIAESLAKERESFDQVDQEADKWRAREIAKDIAKRKVEKMKEIARIKAKEEKKKLDSELELALIVEKLQELRSIRIQKLKKQGHFLPEEDDKFLEKVRAAVEEEERQALAAADTDAAKDAIATAEVSRKTIPSYNPESRDPASATNGSEERNDQRTASADDKISNTSTDKEPGKQFGEVQGYGRMYDYAVNLPMEFYHYYYGSNTDMGTLIEVRRSWDAFIRPGGSRIPGHWVQPPPPADEIWAAYLVRPK